MRRQNVERRRQRSRCCWTLVWYAILYHNIMMRYALDWKGMVWCGIFGPSAAGPYGQEYGTVWQSMLWYVVVMVWHGRVLLDPDPDPPQDSSPQSHTDSSRCSTNPFPKHILTSYVHHKSPGHWAGLLLGKFGDSCPKHFPAKFDQIFILATSLI